MDTAYQQPDQVHSHASQSANALRSPEVTWHLYSFDGRERKLVLKAERVKYAAGELELTEVGFIKFIEVEYIRVPERVTDVEFEVVRHGDNGIRVNIESMTRQYYVICRTLEFVGHG